MCVQGRMYINSITMNSSLGYAQLSSPR